MALPRSKYVQEGQKGVYHCFTRCIRRAFLYGFDASTRRDFSHRKAWVVDRLRFLATIFAIDVVAYAVMENHYHTILRTRPDIVSSWTDREVVARWLMLFPRKLDQIETSAPPSEKDICALSPERISKLRRRLSSLSWFMGQLNEYLARAANKEDGVKGRFWESRFKCQVLLDEASIAACMVYVDLNPIRAGSAITPEESAFTSIQERIRSWEETTKPASAFVEAAQDIQQGSFDSDLTSLGEGRKTARPIPERISSVSRPPNGITPSVGWLCPLRSDSEQPGILPISTSEYFDLVDKSGRIMRPDKKGTIDANLAPILMRIGARPEAWSETTSHFGSKFYLAAGLLSNLRIFADHLGVHWLKGVASARSAFALAPI